MWWGLLTLGVAQLALWLPSWYFDDGGDGTARLSGYFSYAGSWPHSPWRVGVFMALVLAAALLVVGRVLVRGEVRDGDRTALTVVAAAAAVNAGLLALGLLMHNDFVGVTRYWLFRYLGESRVFPIYGSFIVFVFASLSPLLLLRPWIARERLRVLRRVTFGALALVLLTYALTHMYLLKATKPDLDQWLDNGSVLDMARTSWTSFLVAGLISLGLFAASFRSRHNAEV